MERDAALRHLAIERECKKNFLRNTFMHKLLRVYKTEFPVVIRMPNKAASSCTRLFQPFLLS